MMGPAITAQDASDGGALLPSFQPQSGVHCETTTLRNLLSHAGVDVSESMLFGLGEGIDFQYHDSPDPTRTTPFLTGRIGPGDVARNACAAIGIDLVEQQPVDADQAHEQTVELLRAGHAVGVTVDIYHLDYFASKAHFSAHCIALFGLGPTFAHVVDTVQQGGAQKLSVESLRLARASNEGYMPSPHHQLHVAGIGRSRTQRDLNAAIPGLAWHAISATANRILSDRGPKVGLRGMRLAGDEVPSWSESLRDPMSVIPEVGRFWRYAGTGGTNFRGLFLDFLRELEDQIREPELSLAVSDFEAIDGQWNDVIILLIGHAEATDAGKNLDAVQELLHSIATAEKDAFERLQDAADTRVRTWR